MREVLILTFVVFVGVALAIPVGGMLVEWLFITGVWPGTEGRP